MPTIFDNLFVTSPTVNEDDVWSTKTSSIKDGSSLSKLTWPGMLLGRVLPPGLPIPAHLVATPNPKPIRVAARPNAKPKGPRPQPINTGLKEQEPSPPTTDDELFEPEPKLSTPPLRAHGIYGNSPRLPSHRPSSYISEHPCSGDRFAHLAQFRSSQVQMIDKHSVVHLSTMGLERFGMPTISEGEPETGYMSAEDEAEFVQRLDAVSAPNPSSSSAIQLGFGAGGLRGALSNFKARFGTGAESSKKTDRKTEQEDRVCEKLEGGNVDVEHCGWISL